MADDFISKALADAKKTLSDTSNSSVATRSGQPFKPAQNTMSKAPYSLVNKAKEAINKVPVIKEADDVAAGLKARQDMSKGAFDK